MKQCIKCNTLQPLINFGVKNSNKDKLESRCRSCRSKLKKIYRANNKDKIRNSGKLYQECNREKISKRKHRYYINNKQDILDYQKDYKNKKRKEDTNYRLSHALRRRLRSAIKSNQKSGSAVKDLGCTIDELKSHLEKQFFSNPRTGEQMTWDNWSRNGWHIDHIEPLSWFDLQNREEFLRATHYTNMKPLWAKENYSKKNRFKG